MNISGNQLVTLLSLFPNGCDVVEGRTEGTIHAENEGDESGMNRNKGILIGDKGGCLGIDRDTYFNLPE